MPAVGAPLGWFATSCSPIVAAGLAIMVNLAGALNGVAAHLAFELDDELVAVTSARHLEGDFAVLVLAILNGRLLAIGRDEMAGQLIAIGFELDGQLPFLDAEMDGPFPGAVGIHLVLGFCHVGQPDEGKH